MAITTVVVYGYRPKQREEEEEGTGGADIDAPISLLNSVASDMRTHDDWSASEPCAAADQHPLFDWEQEGETALHFLENTPVLSLAADIAEEFFVSALDHLGQLLVTRRYAAVGSHLRRAREDHLRRMAEARRATPTGETAEAKLQMVQELVEELRACEKVVYEAASLQAKFDEPTVVAELLGASEHHVRKEHEGAVLKLLRGYPVTSAFAEKPYLRLIQEFGRPLFSKEYVLKLLSSSCRPPNSSSSASGACNGQWAPPTHGGAPTGSSTPWRRDSTQRCRVYCYTSDEETRLAVSAAEPYWAA
eukprot:GHVU01053997.1.p2 GENE.GHVU01053997.1~~GHVU01053997.1.p2  ORF type:complete len:305 (+),score=74.56 GHVU01053997.1:678-1592(+)